MDPVIKRRHARIQNNRYTRTHTHTHTHTYIHFDPFIRLNGWSRITFFIDWMGMVDDLMCNDDFIRLTEKSHKSKISRNRRIHHKTMNEVKLKRMC